MQKKEENWQKELFVIELGVFNSAKSGGMGKD